MLHFVTSYMKQKRTLESAQYGLEISFNRERGHYREISDRGLDVLTKRQRGQYIISLY